MSEPYKRAIPWLTVGRLKKALENRPDDALVYYEDIPKWKSDHMVKHKCDLFSNSELCALRFIPGSNVITYDGDENVYIVASFLVEN